MKHAARDRVRGYPGPAFIFSSPAGSRPPAWSLVALRFVPQILVRLVNRRNPDSLRDGARRQLERIQNLDLLKRRRLAVKLRWLRSFTVPAPTAIAAEIENAMR